jgi:hypothetical protein
VQQEIQFPNLNRLLYQSSGILLLKTSDKFLSKSKTFVTYSFIIAKSEIIKNPATEAAGCCLSFRAGGNPFLRAYQKYN